MCRTGELNQDGIKKTLFGLLWLNCGVPSGKNFIILLRAKQEGEFFSYLYHLVWFLVKDNNQPVQKSERKMKFAKQVGSVYFEVFHNKAALPQKKIWSTYPNGYNP